MIEVIRYDPIQWSKYAAGAHAAVFNESRPPWLDRLSFALLVVDRGASIGYVTCREINANDLYWQYGGIIEPKRGLVAAKAFSAIKDYSFERYESVTTLVKNDNVNYLHLVMKNGFRVTGIRYHKGDIYLELYMERETWVR